jgi:hypothetical protein
MFEIRMGRNGGRQPIREPGRSCPSGVINILIHALVVWVSLLITLWAYSGE